MTPAEILSEIARRVGNGANFWPTVRLLAREDYEAAQAALTVLASSIATDEQEERAATDPEGFLRGCLFGAMEHGGMTAREELVAVLETAGETAKELSS